MPTAGDNLDGRKGIDSIPGQFPFFRKPKSQTVLLLCYVGRARSIYIGRVRKRRLDAQVKQRAIMTLIKHRRLAVGSFFGMEGEKKTDIRGKSKQTKE